MIAPSKTNLAEKLAVDTVTAAEMTSLSAMTIRRAIKRGELRAARVGSAIRIRPADLDAWLLSMSTTKSEATSD